MGRRPSLRFGRMLRVDFRAKFQGDFRGFVPEQRTGEELFDLRRRRIGVQGRFLRHFEYEVERELREVNPWRDVFVNLRYLRDFQIRAGKFKIPFGLEQLTSPTELDFIFRSRISDHLAPARDIGITAHGRLFRRGLNYEAGAFREDGENARTAGLTIAGRLTGTPLRLIPLPKSVKRAEVGGAFAISELPEGPFGLRGRMISRASFFPNEGQRIFVHGERRRLGAEMSWMPGPFSVKGEFIHVQDERRGQGLLGEDLPHLISRGWYLSGTWALTGEKKDNGIQPRKDFILERGIGAVELAARYEQIRFGSSEHPGRPFRHERAANILGNSNRVWTFGVNWYLNRYVKIQGNAIREKLEDTQGDRSPISGRDRFWTWLCRMQFVM